MTEHLGPTLHPGMLFGERYEVVSRLGEGSFSQVYGAREVGTGQQVALKLLRLLPTHEGGQGEKLAARFRREMRLCAQLEHPHIVRLLGSGEAAGGNRTRSSSMCRGTRWRASWRGRERSSRARPCG